MGKPQKGGFHINMRGLTRDMVSLFIALLLIAMVGVALFNANAALVARAAIQVPLSGANSPAISIPTNPQAAIIHFQTNLPAFDQPTPMHMSDTLAAGTTLRIRYSGALPGVSFTSATVSLDGTLLSTPFVNANNELAFPAVAMPDSTLSEGSHTYSFDLQTSDHRLYHFGETVRVDRTPPVISSMLLSVDRKTLTFHLADPPMNGQPGAGLSFTNASDILDMLNVTLVHANGAASGGSTTGTFTYSLETGLPDVLDCHDTVPGDEHALDCTYRFAKPLSATSIPTIFASDDAGNRTVKSLVGDYVRDYVDSILDQANAHPSVVNLSGASVSAPVAASLQSATPIVLDLYIFHVEPQSPDLDQTLAGWTFPAKVENTLNATADTAQYWRTMLGQLYPGAAPSVSIGQVVGIVPHGFFIPVGTQSLLTRTIQVPDSEYPGFFSSNCNFDAGGVNFNQYCLNRFDPCAFIGCTSQTTYWGASRALNVDLDHAVQPKDAIHIPILVTDTVGSNPNTNAVGAFSDSVHGQINVSYLEHVDPISHHFREGIFRRTLEHEVGHLLGLGHTDDTTNIMFGGEAMSLGSNLLDIQVSRVQAGLVRDAFKPPALGQWWPGPAENDIPFTDCGPVSTQYVNAILPRELDVFAAHTEETEAPYSGKPLSPAADLTQRLQKSYCPLLVDGQGQLIQPAPEAVDPTNVQAILAQYPGAAIYQGKTPECSCVWDSTLIGNGLPHTGGGTWRGGIPSGGGGGRNPKTKEPKSGTTNCGRSVPGYTLPAHGGDTFTVTCPAEKCPDSKAADGSMTHNACKVAQGIDSCGDRSYVEIESGGTTKHYCCKCQPDMGGAEPTSPRAPGDPAPAPV